MGWYLYFQIGLIGAGVVLGLQYFLHRSPLIPASIRKIAALSPWIFSLYLFLRLAQSMTDNVETFLTIARVHALVSSLAVVAILLITQAVSEKWYPRFNSIAAGLYLGLGILRMFHPYAYCFVQSPSLVQIQQGPGCGMYQAIGELHPLFLLSNGLFLVGFLVACSMAVRAALQIRNTRVLLTGGGALVFAGLLFWEMAAMVRGEALASFLPLGIGLYILLLDSLLLVTHKEALATQQDLNFREQILENTPDPVLFADRESRILYVNPAFEKTFGKPLAMLRELSPDFLYADKDLFHEVTAQLQQGRTWQGQVETPLGYGEHRIFDLLTGPVKDRQGQLLGYFGFRRDVTQQEALNRKMEQLARTENLRLMSAGFAHDMRNQLAGALAQLELLEEDAQKGLDKEARTQNGPVQELAQVRRNLLQVNALLKRLMGFAQDHPEQKKRLNLRVALSSVIHNLEHNNSWGFPLVLHTGGVEEAWVLGDQDRLEQAFLNLGLNGLQAMAAGPEPGSGSRELRIELKAQAGGWEIRISDKGPGMAPELQEKIFQPFFSTRKEQGGTGLGLMMVQNTVLRHEGHIAVESRPGEGSTFVLWLPAAVDPA